MVAKALKWRWLDALQSTSGPRSTVRHLCLCLATHMDAEGERCFPGTRMIADEMGVRRQTVMDLVREAARGGWLRVEKRRGGRRGGTYHHYLPAIPVEESGALPAPLTHAEAVRSPHRLGDGSGALDGGSGAFHGLKLVRSADLSSPSVSQISSHGSLPTGEVAEATDGVPQGWEPEDGAIRDPRTLFTLMGDAHKHLAHALLDGNDRHAISAWTDLELLPPPALRRLQWAVTQERGQL